MPVYRPVDNAMGVSIFMPEDKNYEGYHSDFLPENRKKTEIVLNKLSREIFLQIGGYKKIFERMSRLEERSEVLEVLYDVDDKERNVSGAFGELYDNKRDLGIQINLVSSTSLNSQILQIRAVMLHEAGHRLFDLGETYSKLYNRVKTAMIDEQGNVVSYDQTSIPEKALLLQRYRHNQEFMANAWVSLVAGKDMMVNYFEGQVMAPDKPYNESTERKWQRFLHPTNQQNVFALKNGIFAGAVLENLKKVDSATKKKQEFSSYKDFLENEGKYMELQKSVIERV